uniref:Uncharacterized protein n=1 Tax=Rhipicephalus microplus TaxID=6941 RepID=A0A6G5AJ01_RHIMP
MTFKKMLSHLTKEIGIYWKKARMAILRRIKLLKIFLFDTSHIIFLLLIWHILCVMFPPHKRSAPLITCSFSTAKMLYMSQKRDLCLNGTTLPSCVAYSAIVCCTQTVNENERFG